MTTLTNKLQDITKRLQYLTVWRPDERDPFFELDRWRTDAHAAIEQLFMRKRQQMEQIIEKHEREFMRQLTRQRSLLSNIRKRLALKKDRNALNTTQNDISILSDLQKIENDIDTRLGRAEIVIQITPLNYEDSIMVGLKTYLSTTSSLYVKEMSTLNEPKRPKHRTTNEVERAVQKWMQEKKNEEMYVKKELETTKQKKQETDESRLRRQRESSEVFKKWLERKNIERVVVKKKINLNYTDGLQETNKA